MTIERIDISELAEIIAGLVKQGLTFQARPVNGTWTIELTGGF